MHFTFFLQQCFLTMKHDTLLVESKHTGMMKKGIKKKGNLGLEIHFKSHAGFMGKKYEANKPTPFSRHQGHSA